MVETDIDWRLQDFQVSSNGHGPSWPVKPALLPKSADWLNLESMRQHPDFPRAEYRRALHIFREFATAFAALAAIPASVVLWESARCQPEDPSYRSAVESSRLLARAGFGIITGGGPGIMEAANKGVRGGPVGFLSDCPWSRLRVNSPTSSRICPWYSALSSPARPCLSNTLRQ